MSCKQEFDEKLIDCIHSFPMIYDPSKKACNDRIAKDNTWKSIATALECDGKFVVFFFFPVLLCLFNVKYFFNYIVLILKKDYILIKANYKSRYVLTVFTFLFFN